MNIFRRSLYVFRFSADLFLIICGILLSLQITSQFSAISTTRLLLLIPITLSIWMILSKSTNLYDEFRGKYFSFEAVSTLKSVILMTISIIFITYLINVYIARSFLIVFALSTASLLLVQKYCIRQFLILMRANGRNLRSLLIIGAGNTGRQFNEDVNNYIYGYRLLGFLDDQENPALNGQYLGKISDLANILSTQKVDEVVVALPAYAGDKLAEVIKICEKNTITPKLIPHYIKYVSSNYNVSVVGRFPVITLRAEKINEAHWAMAKSIIDIIFSVIFFVCIFSWLWPIIILAIKLETPGSAFYKQERWGKMNRKFYAYKFRSMLLDVAVISESGKYIPTSPKDNRITKVGRILRKYNLDELPQFINILKGEMSMIGPRPHPTPLNIESKDIIDHYMIRHLVKPGLSGWAQVNGFRGEATEPSHMKKRVEHDIWYIENWSWVLDLEIIFLTIWNMIKGDRNAY